MGMHSQSIIANRGVRVAGFSAVQHADLLELFVDRGNNSWPKFAKRLQGLGYLLAVETRMTRVKLLLSVDLETVQRMLSGRKGKTKMPRYVLFAFAVPITVLLAFLPLGNSAKIATPVQVVKTEIRPCSQVAITNWIEGEGEGESEVLKVLTTAVLGGVTVGTLECKGSRYSYTLGSEEPKRVLKLQKLDS